MNCNIFALFIQTQNREPNSCLTKLQKIFKNSEKYSGFLIACPSITQRNMTSFSIKMFSATVSVKSFIRLSMVNLGSGNVRLSRLRQHCLISAVSRANVMWTKCLFLLPSVVWWAIKPDLLLKIFLRCSQSQLYRPLWAEMVHAFKTQSNVKSFLPKKTCNFQMYFKEMSVNIGDVV